MEHETCKKCQYNAYPLCNGTILKDGSQMNIENLKPGFKCGKTYVDHSIVPKTKIELLEERIKELEKKVEG